MGEPARNPGDKPERKEITTFRREYMEALERAKIQVEYTATDGWQNLYSTQRDKIEKRRRDLQERLRALSEAVGSRLLEESEEKELGDLKKESAELRLHDFYWKNEVLEPVMAPLRECDQVIERARTAARNDSRSAPLHTRGLVEEMDAAIETMPRVRFLISSGRLEITPV